MDVFKTLILDTPTVEGANGTVTSVDLTAGTGISVSGGPITSSGSITVTNTSPDQTVALTGGTGISTSGTYPNFTITNDAPDQTVSIAAGTGISTSGTYPSFTVTNSAPDQTVSIAAGDNISVTGSYPSFTVAATGGGLTYVVKTANYTTQNLEGVLADTSGGSFTVTLPATPATGDQLVIADSGDTFGTNNLTVGRNGSTIEGAADDLVLDISGVSVQFVYSGTTWNVYAQIGGNGGTAVTLDGVQTLTNKTLTGAVMNGTVGATTPSTGAFTTVTASSTITPSQTAGIVGTTTNNDANAGSVGEYVESTVASANKIALTNVTPANVTSISLTAGDWDVWGNAYFDPAASTTFDVIISSISTTSATSPLRDTGNQSVLKVLDFGTGIPSSLQPVPQRLSLSTTTTVYLVVVASFAVSTLHSFGTLRARRVR